MIDCQWRNVNFELGTRGVSFCLDEKDRMLHCRVLREKLVSQARPNQPQRGSLTKDYPHWGWLGWACETTWELTTPTKTFGRPVLENSYYANVRMATVLIRLLWWLSRACFKLYRWTRGTGPVFCWPCFCFLHFSVHFLSPHMWNSLRKGILWIKGTVNGAQVAKKSRNKTLLVQI